MNAQSIKASYIVFTVAAGVVATFSFVSIMINGAAGNDLAVFSAGASVAAFGLSALGRKRIGQLK